MPKLKNARNAAPTIAEVIRYLRAGLTPKEIFLETRGAITHENIRVLVHRYREVRRTFAETYLLRNPEKESLPPKLASVLTLGEV